LAAGVTRGEIRLVRFPPPDKERPVLVLTRQALIGALARVTVAPITSTVRDVPSEVALGIDDGLKQPCAINLHNVVTVPKTLLGRRVATLGPERMRAVCGALAFALGCEG
jgi:mRNA interferase MazF